MEERKDSWIACIRKSKFGDTWCGRKSWTEFMLKDLEHAKSCIEHETRVQPCEECTNAQVAELVDAHP